VKVLLHTDAVAELEANVAFYENKEPGLGMKYAKDVYAGFACIATYPEAWRVFCGDTRRYLLNRFYHNIIYRVRAGQVEVLALANDQKRPGYWRNREMLHAR
jgi:catechol 2,3-dioxygenase-like lactoylglutathione lyase family enzyme